MASVIETNVNRPAKTLIVTVAGVGEIRVPIDVLNQDIIEQAIYHGLKQKIVDAAALSRNPETGKSATPEEKFAAMQAVAERLMGMSGPAEWNARAESDGTPEGLLARALMKVTGQDADTVSKFLKALDKKAQAALRADPDIAPVIAEMKAAADASRGRGVDTAGLLAALKGGPGVMGG